MTTEPTDTNSHAASAGRTDETETHSPPSAASASQEADAMDHSQWNDTTRLLVKLWDLHHPQTVTIPKGEIEPNTLREINQCLRERNLLQVPDTEGHEPSPWTQWLVAKGPGPCGTWPKRYARLCRKHGRNLDPATLGVVGSIVGAHVESFHSRTVDLTDTLDWDAGQFGDDGSCYWGERRHARDMLEYYDALALRYYDEDNHHKGIARCWLSTHKPEGLIAWNAYGSVRLVTSARLLATTLGLSYTHIRLENNDSATKEVWINAGGYLIAPQETTDHVTALDLEMDENEAPYNYAEYERPECENCGRAGNSDDMYSVDYGWYCENCYREIFADCDRCGTTTARNDLTTIYYYYHANGHRREHEYCQHCLDAHIDYYTCERCGDGWEGAGNSDGGGDGPYCDTCWDEIQQEAEADRLAANREQWTPETVTP